MGTVFNIQRFSVHDGPGIRTTVFLKGCPLRCPWCHNPEGLSALPQLQYFKEKCIGCGRCGDRDKITDAAKCPSGALIVCGREIDSEELLREVMKDAAFYSGVGGLTFSGGECLLQVDFVCESLKLAKSYGLHTAIDTSGYVPWESIESTLPYCDLYLYDIKAIDSDLHKKFTGVNNRLILENLRRLSSTGKDIWIRVPLIPDFNDSEKEMMAISELVSSLDSIKSLTLMPYHSLGASKYDTLGLSYSYDTNKSISHDSLAKFKDIFLSRGITIS